MKNYRVTYGHLLSKCNIGSSVMYLIEIVKSSRLDSVYFTTTNKHQRQPFLHVCKRWHNVHYIYTWPVTAVALLLECLPPVTGRCFTHKIQPYFPWTARSLLPLPADTKIRWLRLTAVQRPEVCAHFHR